ncbi:RNA binding motif single stranded interacting [Fasciola hepatica]|uniref:RNA binding motif single stranded interacting n=1 Tax=Fasciola hepatica TaxID=6192 RepID=A0A4E0RPP4_FASHE|nr:RNA binding motif single stranded interacting [Fasciola hepatica]
MESSHRTPADTGVVGFLGEKAARSGDPVYIERDEHVMESRCTCSSTDSGRSSISSSQTSHCESDTVEKESSPKHIDKMLSVERSGVSDSHGDDSNEKDSVQDLDMYSDVTLIPKTMGTIIVHPNESKGQAKRTSRSKGSKTAKTRKPRTSSKPTKDKRPLSKDAPSQQKTVKQTSSDQKDNPTKSQQGLSVSTSTINEIPKPRNSYLKVSMEESRSSSIELACRRQSDSSTLSKDQGEHEARITSTASGVSITLNKSSDDSNSKPEGTERENIHSSGSSCNEEENGHLPNNLFSSKASFCSLDDVKGPRKSDHCVPTLDSYTAQPDTTGSELPSTLTINASPKHSSRSVTRSACPQSLVDVEKSELKFSHSTSSSPLPNASQKMRTQMSNKRRLRASGSPVSVGNSPTCKLSLIQRSGKSFPIRPLLPTDFQNNLLLGSSTSRKQWIERNKRAVQNTALLPNPLLPNANCLCLQNVDTQGMLLDQPLYWFLPGFHYSQTNGTGVKNSSADNKSMTPQPTSSPQMDGSILMTTSWQSARYQTASPFAASATECPNAKVPGPKAHFESLAGIRLSDAKPSNGKSVYVPRATLPTKSQFYELSSVSARTDQGANGQSESSAPADPHNQNERTAKKREMFETDRNEVLPYDFKMNTKANQNESANLYLSSELVNSTKIRPILTNADSSRHATVSSVPISICGSEPNDVSRSFFAGSILSGGNTTGQIIPNMVTYNGVSEPCVVPTNFVYVYSTDGQLFAIPSTSMIYPTHTALPNAEIGSVGDSAYSSPAAILSAQTVHEVNLQPTFTANNFEIPNGLLTTGQELTLDSDATLTPQYGSICTNQLALSGHVPPSFPPEVCQWSACNLPVDSEHGPSLTTSSQQQTSAQPILISSQNASMLVQNAYALNSPYMSGSVISNQSRPSIISSGERAGREPIIVQSANALRASQHSQTSNLGESMKPTRSSYEASSGLLGSAKHTGSLLGDSKSMVLHPISTFIDDLTRTGPSNQSGHVRQKKHSSKTNLYIRGLPSTFTEEQLHTLAPDKDLIRSVKLISGTEGEMYGFIDFINNLAARAALLHIKSVNRELYVNFAYESEKDPHNVYITNIPETWTASNVEDLKKIFQPYGQIATAIVMTKRSNNFCTGAGFVRFVRTEDAQRAIEGIRDAQIILDGGKGPLEVKLADRQKPTEDQNSNTKPRTWKPLVDGSTPGSDVSSENQIDSGRPSGVPASKKSGGCLLTANPVSPLLGFALNATNRGIRSANGMSVGQGLLPDAINLNALRCLNNPTTFALAFQNALANTSLVSSNILLPNPLNAVNIPMSLSNESQPSNQSNVPAYRAQAQQISNFLSQTRGLRMSTGLLQNPPLPTSPLYQHQPGLIPLIRNPVDEMTFNTPTVGISGAHPQSAILGHALQPNGTWTASALIPGMFASV